MPSSSSESEESDEDGEELCAAGTDVYDQSLPLYARGFCTVPKMNGTSAAFLGLITELNLSVRQADAVSKFHNSHLNQKTPKDSRSLKEKVEKKTFPPGKQFNKELKFVVPRDIGVVGAELKVHFEFFAHLIFSF